jgi:DNA polymerase-3 subunit chi
MQIVGYHHSISPLEKVLPKLLEKVLASGQRAVVMAGDEQTLKTIDTFLWTYSKSELIPHGTSEDGNPSLQPVWLTCTEENPNQADVLIIVGDLRPKHITMFKKTLILASEWSPQVSEWASTQGEFILWVEQQQSGWAQTKDFS